MITRVREVEGGYRVTLSDSSGERASRETADLAQAFAWQAHAMVHGALTPVAEPASVPAPKKGKRK